MTDTSHFYWRKPVIKRIGEWAKVCKTGSEEYLKNIDMKLELPKNMDENMGFTK